MRRSCSNCCEALTEPRPRWLPQYCPGCRSVALTGLGWGFYAGVSLFAVPLLLYIIFVVLR